MSTLPLPISDAAGPSLPRVAVYIDGLNLYYGLNDAGWQRFQWLDLWRLAENLLRPGQRLASVSYFTARFLPRRDASRRYRYQDAYLQALETIPGLRIQYGYHQPKRAACARCGEVKETFEEKMTDVNIAAALLNDAHRAAFDTAILISGDNDLSGPVRLIRQEYPQQRIVVAFPPRRYGQKLDQAAAASLHIGSSRFRRSQLPASVDKGNGHIIARPPEWR